MPLETFECCVVEPGDETVRVTLHPESDRPSAVAEFRLDTLPDDRPELSEGSVFYFIIHGEGDVEFEFPLDVWTSGEIEAARRRGERLKRRLF